METSVLQTYLYIVDEGSFAAAARRMGISKSLSSKYISDLEKSLGVRLLSRNTRSVRPTALGTDYYGRIKSVLSSLDEANESIRSLSTTPRGPLRIGTPTGYTMAVLRPHMLRFLEDYPEVQLEAVLDDRQSDLVAEGLDAVIRIGALDDTSMIARHLHDTCIYVVASPDYLERHGTPLEPADLAGHNCLHYSNLRGSGTWPFQNGAEVIHQKIRPVFSSNNSEMIRAAALDGKGLALLPDHMVLPDLREGRLQRVLRTHAMPRLPVNLIYPSRKNMSAALRAFIDFTARVNWN